TASLGKTVVGSNCVKVVPPSVEYAADQLAETSTTLPLLAPLGSAIVEPLIPVPLLATNTTSPALAFPAFLFPAFPAIALILVLVCVGVPGIKGPVGIV